MYLLDTHVVSELRKNKPHGAVLAWIETVAEADLYLSVVTLAEIQNGIEKTRRQDSAKAAELESWLDQLSESFNILATDTAVWRAWAKLLFGKSDAPFDNALIAATAQVHKLTVVSRNAADFKQLGVPVLNPFKAVIRS
jgi:toxin FitB